MSYCLVVVSVSSAMACYSCYIYPLTQSLVSVTLYIDSKHFLRTIISEGGGAMWTFPLHKLFGNILM